MKKIKNLCFRNFKVVKVSGTYYINLSSNTMSILISGEKFYRIQKCDLRKMGMKFLVKPKVPKVPKETSEDFVKGMIELGQIIEMNISKFSELGIKVA